MKIFTKKQIINFIIVSVILIISSFTLVAYSASKIQNVNISSEGIMTWYAFEGADRYYISVGGRNAIDYGDRKFDLDRMCTIAKFESGKYNIKIKAANGTTIISEEWIGSYTYTAKPKLSEPTNLKWNDKVISWDIVPNAQKYMVSLYKDGSIFKSNSNIKDTSWDISDFISTGTHTYLLKVIASATDYINSDEVTSGEKVLTKSDMGIQNLNISPEGIMTWDAFEGADRYYISVGGKNANDYGDRKIDLEKMCTIAKFESGNYNVKIKAANGTTIISDEWIGSYTYTAKPKLSEPTNLKWNDKVISWDIVPNAQKYMVSLYIDGSIFKSNSNIKDTSWDISYLVSEGTHTYFFKVIASATDYINSDEVTSSEKVLTRDEMCSIKFDLNGKTGTAPETKIVIKGKIVTKPEDPITEGYTFEGWYIDKNLTKAYNFNEEVKEDIILYAKWIENEKERPWENASNWAIEELDKANELGIIPEIFNEQDLTVNLTRKEFAHIAVKLYEKITGTKAIAIANNPFTDTEDAEVLKAYNIGITNGTSDTTFAPDALITREQMATMMTRALTKAGIDTTVNLEKVSKFSDDDQMHDWGKAAIYYMSNIEIIKGVGNNLFNVLGNATREQALLISERSAEKFTR